MVEQVPALLGQLDREPHSPSFGSFDREHWAWKFRDFPLGMLQCATYPLALLWRFALPDNPYHANDRVLAWILAGVDATVARQHRNGAFDGFAPYEQDPGTTMGIMHALAETTELVEEAAGAAFRDRMEGVLRKAAEFALARDEQHAFVSNHWAWFACGYQVVADLLGEQRYADRAAGMIDEVQARQSREGWYEEYGGPDPGYESLGIFYLSMMWRRTGRRDLLESLGRAVEFYSHFVHPDGSVGGQYGSRNTSLYFPGGFEALSGRVARSAAVARFMRTRLALGNAVTPRLADRENIPPLLASYVEAALVPDPPTDPDPLPATALRGAKAFPLAGLAVVGTAGWYAVVSGGKGGVCRVFHRPTETLQYQDAGYVIEDDAGTWSAQFTGAGRLGQVSDDVVHCEASVLRVNRIQVTPWRFTVLRLANLTAFRNRWLGQRIRSWIVRRLILERKPGPYRVSRRFQFRPEEVVVTDRIDAPGPSAVRSVSRPVALSPIHMGSANYFHPSELQSAPAAGLAAMEGELRAAGSAEVVWRIAPPRDPRTGELEAGSASGPGVIQARAGTAPTLPESTS